MEIIYEHDQLDIINAVNKALFDSRVGLQFVIEDDDQDFDIPSIFYSLVETEELVQE